MSNKTMIVYSQELAVLLIKKGFKLVNSQPNNQNPKMTVYWFVNSPVLQAEIKVYNVNKAN